MKVKILEALKTKYSNLGFSQQVLDGVAIQLSAFVTDESNITTAVEGVETMLKSFQSFADSRVNTQKTEADKLKARLAELEKGKGGNPIPPGAPPTNGDAPEHIKLLQESMTKMQETLQGLQSNQVSKTLKQSFIDKMKEVPQEFYNVSLAGREFKTAEEVEELATTVTQGYDAFKQSSTDLGFSYTKPPENGETHEEESDVVAKMISDDTEKMAEEKRIAEEKQSKN